MSTTHDRTWPVWGLVLILLATIVAGALLGPWKPLAAWAAELLLMAAFIILAGFSVKGAWGGCLVDRRKKMSLSRFQMLAWTVMILSAYLAAVMINVRLGVADPLAVAVPAEIWVLLGISATSLIGSPLLLDHRQRRPINPAKLAENTNLADASWRDLFRGEDEDNAEYLDIGRVQMFYFTFIVLLAYGYALGAQFLHAEAEVTALPEVPAGMLALMGISHSAYLANKALPAAKPAPAGVVQPEAKKGGAP